MFAVIKHQNNQYLIYPDKVYDIDLVTEKGTALGVQDKIIEFTEVLLISNDSEVIIGKPFIKDAKVKAEVLSLTKEPKTTVLKFHSKKRYQRTFGHRTKKTRIKILKIDVKNQK